MDFQQCFPFPDLSILLYGEIINLIYSGLDCFIRNELTIYHKAYGLIILILHAVCRHHIHIA